MYEIQIRVRYSETDEEGFVTPNQILNYFQDTAISHSMALGLNIGGILNPDTAGISSPGMSISTDILLLGRSFTYARILIR